MWARPLLCPDRAFDDVGAIMGRVVLEKGVGANGAFRAREGDPGHVSMTIFYRARSRNMYLFMMNWLFVILCRCPLGTKR
jgi:hypothetical protein